MQTNPLRQALIRNAANAITYGLIMCNNTLASICLSDGGDYKATESVLKREVAEILADNAQESYGHLYDVSHIVREALDILDTRRRVNGEHPKTTQEITVVPVASTSTMTEVQHQNGHNPIVEPVATVPVAAPVPVLQSPTRRTKKDHPKWTQIRSDQDAKLRAEVFRSMVKRENLSPNAFAERYNIGSGSISSYMSAKRFPMATSRAKILEGLVDLGYTDITYEALFDTIPRERDGVLLAGRNKNQVKFQVIDTEADAIASTQVVPNALTPAPADYPVVETHSE